MLHFRFPLHDDDYRRKQSSKKKPLHGGMACRPAAKWYDGDGTAARMNGSDEKASARGRGLPPFLFFITARSILPSSFFEF
jgi:hypothetical protein